MTSRQRMLEAIEFNSPDKIPVVYHSSPAGLYTHGEKLLELFNRYPPDNPISFESIPAAPARTVDDTGRYHEIRADEWGTGWEYMIFGVHGHPKTYPFESWDKTADYQFPPIAPIVRDDIAKQQAEYLVFSGGISIFERLHALRPMDEVLMDIATEDPALLRFLDRLVEYWLEKIHHMIDAGIDVVMFGDDWGTQEAPLISPILFKKLFKPRYERLMAPILESGRKVFFHTCGFLDGVFDDLLDLGVSGLWPQIGIFDADSTHHTKCRKHKVAIYIHPDRQYLVPKGSVGEIEAAITGYAERYHAAKGGGIFYVEIENDAPFENVKALVESIHRWR